MAILGIYKKNIFSIFSYPIMKMFYNKMLEEIYVDKNISLGSRFGGRDRTF